jgi:DNA polymerase-3 subunit gamma/tau
MTRLRHISDVEGIQITDGALRFIARTSTGSARDAISLLDQLTSFGDDEITIERLRSVLGYSDSEIVHRLVAHLCAHEVGPGLTVIQQAFGQGVDMRQFAQQVVDYARSVLLMRVGGDLSADASLLDVDERTQERIQELAERFSVHDLLRAIKLFNQAQLDLRSSDQSQLALELAFVEAALEEDKPAPDAVSETGPSEAPVVVRSSAPAASSTTRTGRRRAPPSAPSRSELPSADQPQIVPGPPQQPVELVTIQEVNDRWSDIRRALKEENFQTEALLNSATEHWMEDGNRLVLNFANDFLSSRMAADSNRLLVERVLQAVLGKLCRMRSTTGESAPYGSSGGSEGPDAGGKDPAVEDSAFTSPDAVTGAVPSQQGESDPLQDVANDPVVQDLISRGGQVTGVQMLSEE